MCSIFLGRDIPKGLHRDRAPKKGQEKIVTRACGSWGLVQVLKTQVTSPQYWRVESKKQAVFVHMGIVLNYCQYGVLYLGSYYNTGPYINFPHFGNSNLGKLPHSGV